MYNIVSGAIQTRAKMFVAPLIRSYARKSWNGHTVKSIASQRSYSTEDPMKKLVDLGSSDEAKSAHTLFAASNNLLALVGAGGAGLLWLVYSFGNKPSRAEVKTSIADLSETMNDKIQNHVVITDQKVDFAVGNWDFSNLTFGILNME